MATPLLPALNRRLATPTTQEEQGWISSAIFGIDINGAEFASVSNGIPSYFQDWYDQQCRHCSLQVSITTHGDLVQVVGFIQEANATFDSVFQRIKAISPPTVRDSQVEASMVLAICVSCAVSFGKIDGSSQPGNVLPWPSNSDVKISEHLNSTFIPSSLTDEVVKLPKLFNAKNIKKIAGIKIGWTNNLADHLLMTDDESKVTLFHHVSILKLQSTSNINILTQCLLQETLQTLALLLPSNDPTVKAWLKSEIASHALDPTIAKCGHLSTRGRDIKKFIFWRDRIIILKQAFDDAEPKTFRQWWHDDRRRVQWFTFWVAVTVLVLTVVFGLVQSVAAVMQTWKTFQGGGDTGGNKPGELQGRGGLLWKL